jgi:phosphoribosylformylglycinamidine synthase
MFDGHQVGILSMEFLHAGRPPVVRSACYTPPAILETSVPTLDTSGIRQALSGILGSLNVASKHWIIRQYDHEVQAGSAVKPLVGPACNGPGDAAVVRPRLDSQRGVVISCGMNPAYGDLDPYHMAASAIDEAVRNAVAVGADPARIAILDNFCWGNTDRPETLGSLVRAALACHDVALAWQTPFISGKDSLNNEFSWLDDQGNKQTLAIPPSLLISAMGQVADVRRCVTMDLKRTGNPIYLIGKTKSEFGGSQLFSLLELAGGHVPQVELELARSLFVRVHQAINSGMIRACHDLSEGGLAVALAEMSFAGQLGVDVELSGAQAASGLESVELLFSESNSRFLVEVDAAREHELLALLAELPAVRLGQVASHNNVSIRLGAQPLLTVPWQELFDAWYQPLNWS